MLSGMNVILIAQGRATSVNYIFFCFRLLHILLLFSSTFYYIPGII